MTTTPTSTPPAAPLPPAPADVPPPPPRPLPPSPSSDGADAAGYAITRASPPLGAPVSDDAPPGVSPTGDDPVGGETPGGGEAEASPSPSAASGDAMDIEMNAGSHAQLTPTNESGQAAPSPAVHGSGSTRPPRERSARGRTPTPTRSFSDILRGNVELRSDQRQVDPRDRIVRPVPSQASIESVLELYRSGADWAAIERAIVAARPIEQEPASYHVIIETGFNHRQEPQGGYLASFVATHDNQKIAGLLEGKSIVQLKRKERRDMELFVRTAEQAKSLVGEKVKLLGGSYTIREADPLEKFFFLDINGVANTYTNEAFRSVFNELKCQLLYDTYREVDEVTGVSAATRRFYFALEQCPRAFLVGGDPCEQIVVGDTVFSVRAKNVKFLRGPRGSARSINLTRYFEKFCPGIGHAPFSDFSVVPDPFGPVTGESHGDAPMEEQQSSGVTSDGHVAGVGHGDDDGCEDGVSAAPGVISVRDPVGCADAGSADGSNTPVNPSPEPAPVPPPVTGSTVSTLAIPAPFVMVGTKRKSSPRSQPVAPPMGLVGFASDNYFSALQETEVDVELIDFGADSDAFYQILPTAVTLPRGPPRKESCRFLRADEQRKKVLVPSDADDLSSILEAMAADAAAAETARSSLSAAAVALLDVHPSRTMTGNTNGDEIISDLLRDPLRFVAHASSAFARDDEKVRHLAEVHLLNRILSATDTTAIRSFPVKWSRVSSERLPASRPALSAMLALLRPNEPGTEAQWQANVALAFFELMFMASAPTLFAHDHWIQYLGGGVIHWLPTPETRLLPINALVGVLRHSCGKSLLARWKTQCLGGPLLTTLEHIQLDDGWGTAERGTLRLVPAADGSPMIRGGPLPTQY